MRLQLLPAIAALILTANQVTAAQGNYGCLNVENGSESQGLYGLNTGRYTELAGQGNSERSVSPDGLYTTNGNNQFVISTKSKTTFLTVDVSGFSNPVNAHWAPNSRYLMLIAASENNQTLLMIISLANKTIKQFTIPDVDQYGSWAFWSPDSHYIAITSNPQPPPDPNYTVSISVYGIDGSVQPNVVEDAVGDLDCGADACDGHDPYEWSSDGRSIYFVQNASDKEFNAFLYDLTTHQTQLLAKNISDFPIYRSDDRYALVQWSERNTIYAGILNLATKKIVTLESNTIPADLKWLDDKALVRWDHSLVWANADGTAKHNLSVAPEKLVNGPTTTQQLDWGQYGWSTDGHWLMVTTRVEDDTNGDSENVWLIDLLNGKTNTFSHVEVPQVDEQFISPDNKVALLKSDDGNMLYWVNLIDGTLYKANIDSSDFSISIYQIVWIPQSDVIAVVPSGNLYPDLYLIRRDGTQIAHYKNFPDLGDPSNFHVDWVHCPDSQSK